MRISRVVEVPPLQLERCCNPGRRFAQKMWLANRSAAVAISRAHEHVTPIGYILLHGANYEPLVCRFKFRFRQAHDRYNNLYNRQELASWKKKS